MADVIMQRVCMDREVCLKRLSRRGLFTFIEHIVSIE